MPLPWADLGPMGLDPCFRYPLDEVSGNFRDIGGLVGKNPGILGGTLLYRQGAPPGCAASVYFGSAGYINIGTAYTNRLWHQYGISVAAWIYRGRDTGANDINPVFVLGPWSFVLQCGHHGSLPFSTYNTMWAGFVNSNGNWDGTLDNAGPLPLNTWVHVVASWDGNRLGIHRNGGDTSSASGITGPGANTGGAMIGCYPDGTSWRMNGFYLSDVRIYPYRLYDGDVQALYNSYFTPVAPKWIKHREPGNLVLHMPLDRANVRDAIGAAVSGAGSAYADAGAGVGPAPGMGSTYFNGSSAYLLARGYPAVDLSGSGGTGWSLAAWIYPTATRTSSSCIITKRYTGGHMPYVLGFGTDVFGGAAGTVYCAGYTGTWYGCRDTIAAPLNQWTHYAATYDGSWFRLYRNGVEVSSANVAVGLNATADDIVIGHRWDNFAASGFPGYIADARIYYGAIGAADIKAIYDRAQAVKRDWMPLGQVY